MEPANDTRDQRPGGGHAAAPERYVAGFLEELAPGFDEWEGGLHRRLAERLVELAAPPLGAACLDIGAGTGLVAELLSPRVGDAGSVVSIDASGRMLEVARQRAAANTRTVAMSIDDVIFRDSSFDLVTVGRSLAYLVSPRDVLAEAHRILKPGGRIVAFCRRRSLSTPAERVFFTVLGRLAHGHPIRLPDHFPEQSDLGERPDLGGLLGALGFDHPVFTDMVTGGHAAGPRRWNELMMESWPAARLLLAGLGPDARTTFEADLDVEMTALADDAYRYHHPYLFALAQRS